MNLEGYLLVGRDARKRVCAGFMASKRELEIEETTSKRWI